MQKKSAVALQRVFHRPGEGHTVDLTVLSNKDNVITAEMDLSTLPVPERRFSCDLVGAQLDQPPTVKLLFAQRQPIGADLLSMLAINIAPESVRQFLESVPEVFSSDFQKVSANYPSAKLTAFSANASQSVVLSSSMIMAGYNGSSACMDFYYSSPFAVQRIGAVKKMSLESVVRVNLSTPHMLALIDALVRGAKEIAWLKEEKAT